MKNILLAGPGYLGRRLALRLRKKGWDVFAICRTPVHGLNEAGAVSILWDLESEGAPPALPAFDAAVFCAAPDEHALSDYESLYYRGSRRFIDAVKTSGRRTKLIYTSSTAVWGRASNDGLIDETTDTRSEDKKAALLLECERLYRESGLDHLILRLGGIYGPGRNRIEDLLAARWPSSAEDRYISLIHVDDAASAIDYLLCEDFRERSYILCDKEPFMISELYAWLCKKLQISPKHQFDQVIPGKRCSSARLSAAGFVFQYPTFREGYEQIFKSEGFI